MRNSGTQNIPKEQKEKGLKKNQTHSYQITSSSSSKECVTSLGLMPVSHSLQELQGPEPIQSLLLEKTQTYHSLTSLLGCGTG